MKFPIREFFCKTFTEEILNRKLRFCAVGNEQGERGVGDKPFCAFALLKKIACCVKQQAEFFLISCSVVAKGFTALSLVHDIKVFFY